jgi:hypothetical protein
MVEEIGDQEHGTADRGDREGDTGHCCTVAHPQEVFLVRLPETKAVVGRWRHEKRRADRR